MSIALTIFGYVMLVGAVGTTALCAATTIIRNRARLLPRLHEIEDRNQFSHDWPEHRP